MTTVRIVRVLPKLLSLNGSQGNADVLAIRASWFGFDVEQTVLDVGTTPSRQPDIVVWGSGTSSVLPRVLDAVSGWHSALSDWYQAGTAFVGIGLGGDVLGASVTGLDETSAREGIGLTPVVTVLGGTRLSGECVGVDYRGREVAGFINDHATRTVDHSTPLMTLHHPDIGDWSGATAPRADGVVSDQLWVATMSGPLMAMNPAIADDVLAHWASRHGIELPAPSDSHRRADSWAESARAGIRSRVA